ncbi:hypothetical protein DAPPUDRAFT_318813 [Daphnia pulex]|uniref:Uncharacterized protein n=1 Tax=Daphnia pulex TaxID=6669 RepID=E9GJQ9_DAPPU|nr:hypothetical protein DAPPUDRAFT_318813 [Daphnia pulex]|eukprot:EFX80273.1 hypothetical protein DAPPUDRAFT_318813 [Daphnia pulex]
MAELIAEEKVIVKFIFPCGGISFLKVSEQEKRRFDADPDFKKKITDAVYNQFLKQKEQSNIQEQLRAEEENRILDGHVEQEEDSETDNEGPGTSRQQRVRSVGHSRVAVIDGNIRVLPKEAVIKTGGKRKATLPSLRMPAVKKRLVIDSPASTSTSHVNKLGDVNDGKDRAVVDIDEYGVDDDEDDDERDSDKWTDYQTDRLLDLMIDLMLPIKKK